MINLVRSSMFTGFGELVTELGGSPELLLRHYSIPIDIERRVDAFIPFRKAVALLERSAQTLACPDFGLQLSARQGLSALGPIAVLASNAKTIEDALRGINKYFHFITPSLTFNFEMNTDQDFIRVHVIIKETAPLESRQLLEMTMGFGHTITRLLAGAHESGQTIYFPHQLLGFQATYEQFFNCEIKFEQDFCAIDLPIALIQNEIKNADEGAERVALEYLAAQYDKAPNNLPAQIRCLIRDLLAAGQCTLNILSDKLHMHPRTLQRRLAMQGAIFEQLLDSERKEMAKIYLSEPNLLLTQVAGMLGYSDQSTLNRSCRRWFNCTPKQFRSQLTHGESSSR
jgi:AraC-like DNA-binding protein